jgi:hypothetical protein
MARLPACSECALVTNPEGNECKGEDSCDTSKGKRKNVQNTVRLTRGAGLGDRILSVCRCAEAGN